MNRNRKDWADKLIDSLLAYRTAFVKPKIMHCFNNYFDYILHIIASNLRILYIFQVRHC